MLELNIWFFVLLVNFLVLLFVLNRILFRPMLGIIKEREETVKGSLESAKEMSGKKDEALAAMQRDLQEARTTAREVFERLRGEGLERQREAVAKASEEAMAMTGKAREGLREESVKARQALRGDVERFSEEILEKILKG